MPKKSAKAKGDHESSQVAADSRRDAAQPVEGKRRRPAPGSLAQTRLEAESTEVAAGRKRKLAEQAGAEPAPAAAEPPAKRGRGRPRKAQPSEQAAEAPAGGADSRAAKEESLKAQKAAAPKSSALAAQGSSRPPSQKFAWYSSGAGVPLVATAGNAGKRAGKPSSDAAGTQQTQQQSQQRQQQQEEAQRRQQEAGKGAAVAGPSATTIAAAPASRRPGQRSPTPAAAAVVLEMSCPASPALDPSSEAEREAYVEHSYQQCADPAYAANTWLMTRLRDPASREAQGAVLRPQLQAVHDQLLANLENTVERSHNSSLLLLGPRGSGKTLVVERAIGAACRQYNTNPGDPLVGVVRLHGYAHNDDRVAFREIARQLCETFGYPYVTSASVHDNMEFLRKMLNQLHRADKVAVFVLDDFDLFAKRAKQAVLYNLLDALQTSGMQAAVIGLTSRFDVIDMLEKRVKSRFSHRVLSVAVPTALAPRAVKLPGGAEGQEDGMLDTLKAMLLLPPAFPHRGFAQRFNSGVEAAVAAQEVGQELSKAMTMTPNDPSPGTSNSATLEHLAIVVEVALRSSYLENCVLSAKHLVEGISQLHALSRGNVLLVAGLPVLEQLLLAAMQRLVASGKTDALNFEMAHQEFRGYASQGGHSDSYTRAAAAKAFDHLITQGLVAFADSRSEGWAANRQYAPVYLQLTGDELLQGMREHGNCPPQLHSWLTKQAGAGNTATMMLR